METIERTLTVDAPAEEVWESPTDPELLAGWLGEVEADLSPGGDLAVRTPDGREREGFVEEVDEGRALAFWWSEDGAPATRVEIGVDDTDGETTITITESRPLATLDRGLEVLWSAGPPAPEMRAAAGMAMR
ncbi:MAG TPA: SRPBCC domain-containing protein [Solirubrobacterales bacterium]|nr:SRPBCC domain-containing protein [Solirubrobacterales bacterium]